MKKLNEIWVPKSKKERVIVILLSWLVSGLLSGLLGGNDVTIAVFGGLAVFITFYTLTQGTDELKQKDNEHREAKRINAENKPKSSLVNTLPIASAKLRYYGGGNISKEKNVQVSVSNNGLKYGFHTIPMEDITGVNLETQSQLSSRLTVTRMATLGIYSLAAPKRKKTVEKFLSIDYGQEFQSTLVFGGKDVTKIQAALIKVKNK